MIWFGVYHALTGGACLAWAGTALRITRNSLLETTIVLAMLG